MNGGEEVGKRQQNPFREVTEINEESRDTIGEGKGVTSFRALEESLDPRPLELIGPSLQHAYAL